MRRKWVSILAGLGVMLLIVLLGVVATGVWLWTQHVQKATVSTATAVDRIASVRRDFGNQPPFIVIGPGENGRVRCSARGEPGALSTIHVLFFDPKDSRLVEADIPFWLARLKALPIRVHGSVGGGPSFTVEDLERCGPGLVIDETDRDGQRVLVWQR